ncbi:hypothetical protein BKK47_09900 [Rodentibacter mrazii]|uniref:Uncharacterized protein n=1 Tax=Rodentibacter mrazii TaxID=1908257 RepID=A0A1V3ICR5_9PAST|nr:hypothetical protein [Rodentibacter mrazii]OOF38187.1 hypothetical protein BKK47_09900 [Rodentibacter mrazii]
MFENDDFENINTYSPSRNDEDEIKDVFLPIPILKYILNVDDFYDESIKPRRKTYTEITTEREKQLEIKNDELKNENTKLKEENELYKSQALNRKDHDVHRIVNEVKYNDREKETHLQAICFLAFRLAEQQPQKFIKPSQAIYTDRIASILEQESQNHCINIRTKDSFQRKLSKAIKTFSTITEEAD